MVANSSTLRIGIYGPEEEAFAGSRGCALWPVGYSAAVTATGALPVVLRDKIGRHTWGDVLGDLQGIVWAGKPHENGYATAEEERLCQWCRKNSFPLLAVDHAMLALNTVFGGAVHLDLTRERSEA